VRYLFLARFVLFNFAAAAGLAVSVYQGYWRGVVPEGDEGLLVWIVAGIVAAGLWFSCHRAWWLARLFDDRDRAREALYGGCDAIDRPGTALRGAEAKLTARIAVVRWYASAAVLCGLIGTVIGFMIALSGVDPERIGDVTTATGMVATLIRGLGVALGTTLVGSLGGLWLIVNYAMLAGAAARLFTAEARRFQ